MTVGEPPVAPTLTDAAALAAVRRIRAISWRWRWREVLRAPGIVWGLGRRHYGVAAQDVEHELAGHLPGIVICNRAAACPRHRQSTVDFNAACTGRLKVRYRMLADVVAMAARQAGLAGPADVGSAGPGTTVLARHCHGRIAAIQLSCLDRDDPPVGR